MKRAEGCNFSCTGCMVYDVLRNTCKYVDAPLTDSTGLHAVKQGTLSAFDVQVGGSHYKNLAIQPAEYSMKNKLPWAEGNVVKYITRHPSKGGAEDVRKVIQMARMILEIEYGIKE